MIAKMFKAGKPTIGRGIVTMGALVTVSGCRPDRVNEPFQPPAAAASASIPAVPGNVRDDEESFAEISRVAPGAAGYYVDEGGNLVLLLRDQEQGAAARGALARLKSEGRLPATERVLRVIVKPAQFSFGQLAEWRNRVFESLFGKIDGITSLDLDEQRNRVTIGLEPTRARELRPMVVEAAAKLGVDTAALNFREHANLRYSGMAAASASILGYSLQHTFDTIVGGIDMWSSSSMVLGGAGGNCTIGFVALRNSARRFVTATHCTATWGGLDNTIASQAGVGRRIGAEVLDPSPTSCGVFGMDDCRQSDASMFSIDDSVDALHGLIARTTYANNGYYNGGNGSLVIDADRPYFIITAVYSVPVGWYVHKMGRTTGWTWGTITNTCVDHHYGSWPGFLTTTCTYEANIREDVGDSGGPLFTTTDGGDAVGLVGTLVGSTTTQNGVFSKYSRIAAEMGGTIVVTRGINLSTPSNIAGSISGGNPVVSWNAVSGATHYYVHAQRWFFTGYDEWGNPTYEYGPSEYRGVTTSTSFTDSYQSVSVVVQRKWTRGVFV